MADGEEPRVSSERTRGAGRSARYFCTAGRGMEPFLRREVAARLGATEVDYVSGKVFFTTSADLGMLKKLKSAERLFLLLNKYPPLTISRNKGKIIYDIQNLVNENPSCWLDVVTFWKSLHDQEEKPENTSQKYPGSQKRKLEDGRTIKNKKQKGKLILETAPAESQMENQQICDVSEAHKDNVLSQFPSFLEMTPEVLGEKSVESNSSIIFRVSCRCSGVLAKTFTAQEIGKIIGIALMKSFGWKADLRNPDLEIFVHLNDIYCIIGIPVFRLPLANRVYIKTAGLRSTIAWAMASVAEIKTGAFVLDPTCGLGTVLLEAAMEWPNVNYLGTDISDSQLEGAYSNIKAANLMDKIQLLKASVTALPLPSESIDVVLADIPFGKKFKITKNMKLLPNVFQELESHDGSYLHWFHRTENPLIHTFLTDHDLIYPPSRYEGLEKIGKIENIGLWNIVLEVLCVGGTAVLLLSQELYKCLSYGITSSTESENHISVEAASDCTQNAMVTVRSDSKEKSGSLRTVSPSADHEGKEYIASKRTTLGSLVLVESFEVSLGKTDAFICKYKKPVTCPTGR